MATKANNKANTSVAKAKKEPYTGSPEAEKAIKNSNKFRWDFAYVITSECNNYGNRSAVYSWFEANSDYSKATIKQYDEAGRVANALIKGRYCTRIQLNNNGAPSSFRQYIGTIGKLYTDKKRLAKLGNDVKARKANGAKKATPKGKNGGNGTPKGADNSPQFDPTEAINTVNKYVETGGNSEMIDLACKVMARIETNILQGMTLKDGEIRKFQAQMTSLASAHMGAKVEAFKFANSAKVA